jgi:hypothetical protein
MVRIAFFFGDLGGLSCSMEPVSIGNSLGTSCFFGGGQCHHHTGGDSHRVAAIQRSRKDVGPRDDGYGPRPTQYLNSKAAQKLVTLK